MDLTVVSGVPGVGASEVCRTARAELGDGYELINFGDVMLEKAAARGLTRDRDELSKLSQRDLQLLQRRSAEYVAGRARGRAVILNTHLAVATVHGYLPGLSRSSLRDVDPDRFVLIEASPETIASRREEASYRSYRETGVHSIDFHQDLTRTAAMSYAMQTDAPVRMVENESSIEDAAADLVAIVTEGDPVE
ncbi:adenylate kinase [Halalkaliarchaeum desulfuricum]|uniref:Adenylate kinase n=1 Tax=Halalkaliarchaeum desulfuricum TaxID=2055893 RepID=A0A343TG32_9EURY|nr:adenylate kinase [Halalkaliarchaeum desulfuricum]AUX08054.1 adenylate kinase [Halalkaliarchaeum desulfuricum]